MDGTKTIRDPYDADFLAWAGKQAAALRARDAEALDWDALAEEVADLGASDRRELENRIATILEHLLKLDHGRAREPERKWRVTVETQREDLQDLLAKLPSLRRNVGAAVIAEYARARRKALKSFAIYEPDEDYDTRIPVRCPYTEADILGSE